MGSIERIVVADVDAVAAAAAAETARILRDRHSLGERPSIALTGGTAGVRTAAALADEVIPWADTDIYYGDERFVPEGHDDRNDAQLDVALIRRIGGAPPRLHRWPARSDDLDDVDAAAAFFASEQGRFRSGFGFDVHLLGMGGEGHVNSLFPDSPAIAETGHAIVGVRDCPKPPPERMTFTLPVIRRSRNVFLVVAGADKAEAVARAAKPGVTPEELPAAGCTGTVSTIWFLDEAAASLLD